MTDQSQNNIESLLSTITEEEFLKFAKDYLWTHPEMRKALEAKYVKKQEKRLPFDYKKEVAKCYTHVMKRVRWERDWSFQPEYLDWEKVGNSLKRVIKLAEEQLTDGNPQVAVETALLILDSDLTQYEEDFLSEREDWDAEDLCIDESVLLISKSLASSEMSDKQKLDVCDRLEQYTGTEIFEYCEVDVHEMIESTRDALLSDDDHLAILFRNFGREKSDWEKDCLACDIWDFLMKIGREDEAIGFSRKYPELSNLQENYVAHLISQGKFKEVVSILDKAIKLAKKNDYSGLVRKWRELKLEVLEQMKDTPASIALCRQLFIDAHGNDVKKYYDKLKCIVATEEWSEFRDELLSQFDNGQNADSPLSAIYAEENMIPQLYNLLASSRYNLISALKNYAKVFDATQQKNLVALLEPEFISGIGYNPTRKTYKQLAGNIRFLAGICPAAHELALKALNYYLTTYSNRPALQEELSKVNL